MWRNTRRSIERIRAYGRNAYEASEQRRVGRLDRLARGDVGLRFTDDENRILELHVTGLAAQAPSFKAGVSRYFFD